MVILRKSVLPLAAAITLTSLLGGTAARAQTQISVAGAHAKDGTTNQVRLFWVVTQGWVPASGVNIYRSDNPTTAINTGGPIKLDETALSVNARTKIKGTVTASRKLFATGPRTAGTGSEAGGVQSSRAAFSAFKGEVQKLQTKPGMRADQMAAQAGKTAEVVDYRKRLKPPVVIGKTEKPAVQSDEDQAVSARIQVMLASMNKYTTALKLGMAYIDTTADPTRSYTYTLKSADTPAVELAHVTVSAMTGPADLAPPAPTQVDATQLGATSVALHWEPITAAQETALVNVTYDVYRDGTKMNTAAPIRLPFLPTTDGGHIAPMTNYIDQNTPRYGTFDYSVTLTDVFGRTSAPVHISATVADLRTPGPVKLVRSILSKSRQGAVRVYWYQPDPTAGDIAPAYDQSAFQFIPPPTSYDVSRAEDGHTFSPLTQNGGVTAGGAPAANGIPPELADMTVDDLLTLNPAWEGSLTHGDVIFGAAMTPDDLKALRDQTIDKLYARIGMLNQGYLQAELLKIHTYLDTTTIADKGYTYSVAACYTANTSHHGAEAVANPIVVPTTAIPPTPAGLAGNFAVGAGSFGFLNTGSVPTMRKEGVVGAEFAQSHINKPVAATTAAGAAAAASEKSSSGTGAVSSILSGGTGKVVQTLHAAPGTKVVNNQRKTIVAPKINPKYPLADNEKAPPVAIAGRVTLTWQASPFTSAVRYRIYRASATGLFPSFQTASLGAPPNLPNIKSSIKIGAPNRGAFVAANKRFTSPFSYYEDYPRVPNENFVLLGETTGLTFVDTLPLSQRVHYHYSIVPVSRWGVVGSQTSVVDVMVPATLPPSTPTLLKTSVDESTADGHVRLTLGTNPANENVAKYYVYRWKMASAAQTAIQNLRNTQVAAKGKFAPPIAPLKVQTDLRYSSAKVLKANNNALLKSILNVTAYAKVGEVAVPATIPADGLTYIDTTGLPRTPYAYMVVAVNKDAIGSQPSSPLDGTALKVRCDIPRNLAAAVDTSGDAPQIKLTWQVPALETPAQYVLERAVTKLSTPASVPPLPANATPAEKAAWLKQYGASNTASPAILNQFLPYVTVAAGLTTTSYTDTDVRSGRHYIYRLRAADANGLFSLPLQATGDVPALAAAVFNDPPPSKTPTENRRPPLGNTPPPADTGPKEPASGGTPTSTATISAPQAPTNEATFNKAYYTNSRDTFAVQVQKAAYRIEGYAIDAQNYYYCKPTEKFLLLTLRVKNTSSAPLNFDYQTVSIGGAGPEGDDLSPTKNWKALDTGGLANRVLAAGAEMTIEGVVTIPASGDPKTISFGTTVFDLSSGQNAIQPLPAQFGGGSTAAPEMPAQNGTYYPLAYTDGTVASVTRSGGTTTVALKVKNATLASLTTSQRNYTLELYDEDGDKYTVAATQASTDTSLAPGQETTLNFSFPVPAAIKLQSLKARERDGRIYVFPIGVQ